MVIGSGYYPNIQWIVGTVTGVTRDSKHPTHLQSVSVRTTQGPQDIEAVFVVDCTGPASAGVKWIKREGYGYAETYSKNALPLDQLKLSYDQKIRYATLEFSIPPALGKRLPIPGGFYTQGSIYTCVARSDKDRCSAYASTLDGDRLQVLCGTWGAGEDPPRTIQATKEYIHAMVLDERPPQWWFDMLDLLTEVEDKMTCSIVRVPPTPYIRFHKATNLPSNWVAIGDSVMRLNPVFGQGCSKAMLDVVSLNNVLHSMATSESKAGSRLPKDFSKRFFAAQEQKIKPLWLATKTFDYGYDTTIPIPGETLSSGAFIRWYMRQLQTLAFTDMDLASTMWHISMMMAPGIDNLHPLTVVKVLWNSIRTHVCTVVGA
ncbi:hypothetical protein SERLA73DRAFT_186054 [Serpula lacrymans var. lacrymans S7.3]|uniref:FAD-binding domain-containing protein n=2 Tax=Serpula lacrymans var. lacrymans TaxID=341189 RepID=F8Q6V4_SERL3|nr:uncharacterized protein SERLADRAFT_474912 [Serpula lacrymans var. lacrymans S7.9]EGN96342.1 hypothetical protein SERLA73DRAFT_186054 [Serpula lacrymans var. lacrymans S7.3]EGO21882.1 hypothetical protein SERLADRAFT_474912 [Serpula lacrymans var. lacrymans S7.9]